MRILVDLHYFDFIFFVIRESESLNLKEYFPNSYIWPRRESERTEDRQILGTVLYYLC